MRQTLLLTVSSILLLTAFASAEALKVLIIDGQNNHQWQVTTPVLKRILENTGRFQVDTVTTPPAGQDLSAFRPDFSGYSALLSNYNGDSWPEGTNRAFLEYMQNGGGFVVFHAADNAFPEWPEYNRMIGLGGWGDRTESHGPYLRWRDGRAVRVNEPGKTGSHGKRHPYILENRAPDHPITKGLPSRWLHSTDELYDRLRGPAENLEVLATAYSDPATGGSGEHEPLLMTVRFGEGRIFHTVLGDNLEPLFNVGFQITLVRGTEWAATGGVTLPLPPYSPSETVAVTRDPFTPYARDGLHWRPLFNGKDLNGWEQVNGTAQYRVDRSTGTLIGTTAEGSPNSFLSTVDEYADFELRFEVLLDNNELNSGIQIRSHQYAEETEIETDGRKARHPRGRVFGYQVEIEASADAQNPGDTPGNAGFVYDEARRGWLSDATARTDPARRSAFVNGGWNQYHIRCVGDHIQTWINGIRIADLHDSVTARGRIMLQVHSIPRDQGPWSVRWRNIFIREIDGS